MTCILKKFKKYCLLIFRFSLGIFWENPGIEYRILNTSFVEYLEPKTISNTWYRFGFGTISVRFRKIFSRLIPSVLIYVVSITLDRHNMEIKGLAPLTTP